MPRIFLWLHFIGCVSFVDSMLPFVHPQTSVGNKSRLQQQQQQSEHRRDERFFALQAAEEKHFSNHHNPQHKQQLLWGWLWHHASTTTRLLLSPNETATGATTAATATAKTTTAVVKNRSIPFLFNLSSSLSSSLSQQQHQHQSLSRVNNETTTFITDTSSTTSTTVTSTTTLNNQQHQQQPQIPSNKTTHVLKYFHPNGTVYQALNTSPDKFQAFLQYLGFHIPATVTHKYPFVQDYVNATQELRDEWRTLWKQERLLTDRTELLAVYPSDQKQKSNSDGNSNSCDNGSDLSASKRGGFSDHLYLYTERLLSILRDEHSLLQLSTTHHSNDKENWLLTWLAKNYNRTQQLLELSSIHDQTEQLAELKRLLEWFRSQFPYYYDRCSSCGASYREDCAAQQESDAQHGSFLGYIHPNPNEVSGKASRTELYHCHVCRQYTRFPRYNSARHVVQARQGRCGEYSVLLFALLRAIGQEARWVVDWADHVWAEIRLQDRWIHLDPCEAAVDENDIYQGWGKQQTYILAFYAPPRRDARSNYPLIEDVTNQYTTDTWQLIRKRRDESEAMIQQSIQEATERLKQQLASQEYLND